MIFSTVTQFVEQVGRRRIDKYGDLDQLLCVYIGPSDQVGSFVPNIDSAHPEYPLMFVTDSQVTWHEALVSEVSVTFTGKVLTSGQTQYISPPITSENVVQGSRDFVSAWSHSIGTQLLYAPTEGQVYTLLQPVELFNCGTQTLTVRYFGTQCSVKYQAYPRPTDFKYASLGLSRVKWSVISRTLGPITTVNSGVTADVVAQFKTTIAKPPDLFGSALGISIEQQGKWFTCTEVYGPTF